MIQRALLSVSDKRGLMDLAFGLAQMGIELVSTGGTAKALLQGGLKVKEVEQLTGFPEMMDGRVKTLHPKVHGGILAVRSLESHRRAMIANGIEPIDLVVVNLYPFYQTITREGGVSLEEAVENIDIGGPAMIRSAAKNHADVAVIVDPDDYAPVLEEIRASQCLGQETRYRLALKAFRHTAFYDTMIADYLGERVGQGVTTFPEQLTLNLSRVQELRYGENPHQAAALYREPIVYGPSLVKAKQLQGKELSFCNLNDANAALDMVLEYQQPAAVAIKHTNPCGAALADSLADAYRRCHSADPVSIFGGIVALNRPVDEETATLLSQTFLEVILAPSFTVDAISILQKKKNLRLLELTDWQAGQAGKSFDLKRIRGGYLLQSQDELDRDPNRWQIVTKQQPGVQELHDLLFAWALVKHVKSNAIVVAKGSSTLGIGGGQTNRIDPTRYALSKAGDQAKGAVLASDAFFPFADVVEECAKAGISAIIQPGGSLHDAESIEAADRHGIAMVFTGKRHFKH